MTRSGYHNLVRAFGIYHAVAAFPLMLPLVSAALFEVAGRLHFEMGLAGNWHSLSDTGHLFVNLFGAAAFVWATFRILYPSYSVGRLEGWAMLLFSGVVITNVFFGVSLIWLVIPAVDLPGGLLHLHFGSKRHERTS